MTATEQKFYTLLLSMEDRLAKLEFALAPQKEVKKKSGTTRKSNVVRRKSK